MTDLFRGMRPTINEFYAASIHSLSKLNLDVVLQGHFSKVTATLELYHSIPEWKVISKWKAANALSSSVSITEIAAMKARVAGIELPNTFPLRPELVDKWGILSALIPHLDEVLSEREDPDFDGMYRILEHIDRETHKFILGNSSLAAAVIGGIIGAAFMTVLTAIVG